MSSVRIEPTPLSGSLKVRLVEVTATLLERDLEKKLPTMREIAVSAGVSPGAAYRHFSSQGELFLNVVEHVFGHLESATTATLDLSQGVDVGLRRIAHAYVQWGLEHPGGYQLLFETTDDAKLLAAGQRPGLHLIDQIGDYWESEISGTVDGRFLAVHLWASLHGIVSLRTHKIGMTWPMTVSDEVDALLDLLLSNATP